MSEKEFTGQERIEYTANMLAVADELRMLISYMITKRGTGPVLDALFLSAFKLAYYYSFEAEEYQKMVEGYAKKIPALWCDLAANDCAEQKLR